MANDTKKLGKIIDDLIVVTANEPDMKKRDRLIAKAEEKLKDLGAEVFRDEEIAILKTPDLRYTDMKKQMQEKSEWLVSGQPESKNTAGTPAPEAAEALDTVAAASTPEQPSDDADAILAPIVVELANVVAAQSDQEKQTHIDQMNTLITAVGGEPLDADEINILMTAKDVEEANTKLNKHANQSTHTAYSTLAAAAPQIDPNEQANLNIAKKGTARASAPSGSIDDQSPEEVAARQNAQNAQTAKLREAARLYMAYMAALYFSDPYNDDSKKTEAFRKATSTLTKKLPVVYSTFPGLSGQPDILISVALDENLLEIGIEKPAYLGALFDAETNTEIKVRDILSEDKPTLLARVSYMAAVERLADFLADSAAGLDPQGYTLKGGRPEVLDVAFKQAFMEMAEVAGIPQAKAATLIDIDPHVENRFNKDEKISQHLQNSMALFKNNPAHAELMNAIRGLKDSLHANLAVATKPHGSAEEAPEETVTTSPNETDDPNAAASSDDPAPEGPTPNSGGDGAETDDPNAAASSDGPAPEGPTQNGGGNGAETDIALNFDDNSSGPIFTAEPPNHRPVEVHYHYYNCKTVNIGGAQGDQTPTATDLSVINLAPDLKKLTHDFSNTKPDVVIVSPNGEATPSAAMAHSAAASVPEDVQEQVALLAAPQTPARLPPPSNQSAGR